MGRSVSYPSNAVVTFGNVEYNDDYADYVWDELVDDFRSRLSEMFPSVRYVDDWIGREDHVLAENGHARFGMSEYGGLVSYWMVPQQDSYGAMSPLAEHWVDQATTKFTKFGTLKKVGVFSNGGGIYEPINGHDPGPDQFDQKPYVINGTVTDG
jgi:hypothetical protein